MINRYQVLAIYLGCYDVYGPIPIHDFALFTASVVNLGQILHLFCILLFNITDVED